MTSKIVYPRTSPKPEPDLSPILDAENSGHKAAGRANQHTKGAVKNGDVRFAPNGPGIPARWTNWVANFAVTVTFLPLMKHIGLSWTYGLYTLAAAASVVFVLTAVRETKGKALEEM